MPSPELENETHWWLGSWIPFRCSQSPMVLCWTFLNYFQSFHTTTNYYAKKEGFCFTQGSYLTRGSTGEAASTKPPKAKRCQTRVQLTGTQVNRVVQADSAEWQSMMCSLYIWIYHSPGDEQVSRVPAKHLKITDLRRSCFQTFAIFLSLASHVWVIDIHISCTASSFTPR
jgi:hypothetical protein